MNDPWLPEHDRYILEETAAGSSAKQIAQGLVEQYQAHRTPDSVSGRLRRLREANIEPPLSPEERFAASVAREKAKAVDKAMTRELAAAIKAKARWEEFLELVEGALATTDRPQLQQLDIPSGTGTPEIMTVLVGDIHIGKLVDPAAVGHNFGYGVPIFQERLVRLKNRILRLFSLHSSTAPISEVRIYFLGDGVDGTDMRRGHAHRVDVQTATQQVLILVYAMEGLVRELEGFLGVRVVLVWEFGNHGRVGEFGVNLPADNWDYIAGQMLGIALRDLIESGRVRLHADTLKYSITQLGPYRVYSSHYDGVRGGDGFSGLPINGLARGTAKDAGLHLQLFDLHLTAHFHSVQDLTFQTSRLIQNGAWDGGDDYSVNGIKAASEPEQVAFGVHPRRGITWQSRIQLTPERRQPSPVEDLD